MTAYAANGTSSLGATSQFGVKTGATYQTRIARVELVATTAGTVTVSVYTGGSLTGGTSVTPFAMRAGSAATTATAKWAATVSGTQSQLTAQVVAAGGATNYSPPFDLLLAPGTIIWISGVNLTSASVFFDELHLARSV